MKLKQYLESYFISQYGIKDRSILDRIIFLVTIYLELIGTFARRVIFSNDPKPIRKIAHDALKRLLKD